MPGNGEHSETDQEHGPTVSIDTDYLGTMDVQLDPPRWSDSG